MKVFIVVLVLLLLLFSVGIGLGMRKEGGKSKTPGSFEKGLESLFASMRPAVELEGNPKGVTSGGSLKIKESNSPIRTLKLRKTKGCEWTAVYRGDPPLKAELNPMKLKFRTEDPDTNSIPVQKGKGTISDVRCSTNHSCPGLQIVRD